jgi:hypothetical protein
MALGEFVSTFNKTRRRGGLPDDVFHSVDWTSFSSAVANTKESIIKLIND